MAARLAPQPWLVASLSRRCGTALQLTALPARHGAGCDSTPSRGPCMMVVPLALFKLCEDTAKAEHARYWTATFVRGPHCLERVARHMHLQCTVYCPALLSRNICVHCGLPTVSSLAVPGRHLTKSRVTIHLVPADAARGSHADSPGIRPTSHAISRPGGLQNQVADFKCSAESSRKLLEEAIQENVSASKPPCITHPAARHRACICSGSH